MRERCAIAGSRAVDSIIAPLEIKTQSRRLAEFCRRMLRPAESLSKDETSKTDVPSANVAKLEPAAIKERARSASHLMNPRSAR